jgi:hypothetical protein
MKQVIDGNGQDSTAAVAAWLATNNELWIRNLYLFGDPDDPQALWLTDHESPLLWSLWGTFLPAVIKRGTVNSSIGLDMDKLDIDWSPPVASFIKTTQLASPYQLARLGFYDNWPVRVWTVYMPTPGDADTFGCSELFGGRISNIQVERGKIEFSVTSFLDVVNQNVPTNVVELTNTLAAYRGATPPAGLSQVPRFTVKAGSTTTKIIGNCTSPTPGQVFTDNAMQFGFLVFNRGDGQTLGGFWSGIASNSGAAGLNTFILFSPLPWPPTPDVDTFYVSAAFPINKDDGQYFGFPFVPSPETGV